MYVVEPKGSCVFDPVPGVAIPPNCGPPAKEAVVVVVEVATVVAVAVPLVIVGIIVVTGMPGPFDPVPLLLLPLGEAGVPCVWTLEVGVGACE